MSEATYDLAINVMSYALAMLAGFYLMWFTPASRAKLAFWLSSEPKTTLHKAIAAMAPTLYLIIGFGILLGLAYYVNPGTAVGFAMGHVMGLKGSREMFDGDYKQEMEKANPV